MQYDIKLRLDEGAIQAIDEARGNRAEWLLPSGRSIPPSRVEMIRRLITRGLATASVADQIAASKRRTAESRERVSRRANVAAHNAAKMR